MNGGDYLALMLVFYKSWLYSFLAKQLHHLDVKEIGVYLCIHTKRKNKLEHKRLNDLVYDNYCDAPNPGGPLTTRQPAKNLYISYHETHT